MHKDIENEDDICCFDMNFSKYIFQKKSIISLNKTSCFVKLTFHFVVKMFLLKSHVIDYFSI